MRLLILSLLLVSCTAKGQTKIEIVDSKVDSRLSYILITEGRSFCQVPVQKAKLKDWCYVMKTINESCGLSLKDKDCK